MRWLIWPYYGSANHSFLWVCKKKSFIVDRLFVTAFSILHVTFLLFLGAPFAAQTVTFHSHSHWNASRVTSDAFITMREGRAGLAPLAAAPAAPRNPMHFKCFRFRCEIRSRRPMTRVAVVDHYYSPVIKYSKAEWFVTATPFCSWRWRALALRLLSWQKKPHSSFRTK